MLIHPTVERLRALGLTAMADAFIELQNAPDAGELSREDWLGLLVDREATSRENKRLARRLREARLRQSAVVEDVDFRAHRGLDRALFLKLATCQWIQDHHHLCVIGPTGIGKSWLACALGHKGCREGLSVLYKRASRLFADLAQARGEGRLPRLLTTLERIRLLIIDDWGPEPLDSQQRRDLLEIVESTLLGHSASHSERLFLPLSCHSTKPASTKPLSRPPKHPLRGVRTNQRASEWS